MCKRLKGEQKGKTGCENIHKFMQSFRFMTAGFDVLSGGLTCRVYAFLYFQTLIECLGVWNQLLSNHQTRVTFFTTTSEQPKANQCASAWLITKRRLISVLIYPVKCAFIFPLVTTSRLSCSFCLRFSFMEKPSL